MQALDLLFSADAVTYARHVRDMLMLRAVGDVAKAQMTYHARMLRRMTLKQIVSHKEDSDDQGCAGSLGDIVVGPKRHVP